MKRIYIEDVLSFRARQYFGRQYQTQLYRGRALHLVRQYFASISNVVIQRTCSPLGQTVFCINIKMDSIYTSISNVVIQRTCSPLGRQYFASISNVVIYVLSFVFTHQYQTQLYRGRALLQGRQYFASISNVVIQRTCSPLGRTVFTHQYQRQSYKGRALLQCRQYLHINIKRSYIEDVLSFRADSIYTSILYVVIQRTCSPLGQRVFCITIKRSYIEDVLSFTADSIYTSI